MVFSGLVAMQVDALGRPTGLEAMTEGDVIYSGILSRNVRDATRVVEDSSSTWNAGGGGGVIPDSVSGVWQSAADTLGTFSGSVEASTGIIDGRVDDLDSSADGWNDVSTLVSQSSSTWNAGGAVTISDAVSGPWQQTYDTVSVFSGTVEVSTGIIDGRVDDLDAFSGTVDTSTGIIDGRVDSLDVFSGTVEVSTGIIDGRVDSLDVFSGTVEVSTGIIDGRVDDLDAFSGTVEVSTGIIDGRVDDLDAFSGTVDTSTGLLDGRVTLLDVFSGSVETSTTAIDGRVIVVEGLVPSATGHINWTRIYNDRANLVTTSGNTVTNTTNVGILDASTTALNEFSGTVDTSTSLLDGRVTLLNDWSGTVDTSTSLLDGRVDDLDSSAAGWNDISAVVTDSSSTWNAGGAVTIPDAVSGPWEQTHDTVSVFSGSVEVSTGVLDGRVDDLDAFSGTVDTSTGLLDGRVTLLDAFSGTVEVSTGIIDGRVDDLDAFSGTVDTSTGLLDGRVTLLNDWSGTVDTSTAGIDGRVIVVEALVPSATGHTNWTRIYNDRANLVTTSGNTVTNTTNIATQTGRVDDLDSSAAGWNTVSALVADSSSAWNAGGSVEISDAVSGPWEQTHDTVSVFSGSVETSTTVLDGRVDALDAFSGTVEVSTGIIDGRVDALDAFSGTVDTSTGLLDGRVTLLNDWSGTVDTSTSLLDGRVDDLDAFSGTVDTSTSLLDGRVDDLDAFSGTVDTSTSLLDGRVTLLDVWSGTVDTSTGLLDGRVTLLDVFSGSVETSTTAIDGRVIVVEGLVPSATGHADWTRIYNDRANIVTTSGNTVTNTTNVGILDASTTALNEFSGTVEVSTGIIDGRVDTLDVWSGTVEVSTGIIDGRVDSLDVFSGSVDTSTSVLDGRVDTLDTWSGTVEVSTGILDGRVDTLDTWSGTVEVSTGVLDGRVDGNDTDIGNNTGNIATQTSRVDTLDASTHALNVFSGSVETSTTAIDGRVIVVEALVPSATGHADWTRIYNDRANIVTTSGDTITNTTNVGILDGRVDTLDTWSGTVEVSTGIIDGRVDTLDVWSGTVDASTAGVRDSSGTAWLTGATPTLSNDLDANGNNIRGANLSVCSTTGDLTFSAVGDAVVGTTLRMGSNKYIKGQDGGNFLLSGTNTYFLGSANLKFGSEIANTSSLIPIINDLASVSATGGGGGGPISYIQLSGIGGQNNLNILGDRNFILFESTQFTGGAAGTDFSVTAGASFVGLKINTAGTYEVSFNISTNSSTARTAVVMQPMYGVLQTPGAPGSGDESFGPACQTGYIRITSGHSQSSYNLSPFLWTFAANDVLNIGSTLEAAAGTVNSNAGQVFLLVKRIT